MQGQNIEEEYAEKLGADMMRRNPRMARLLGFRMPERKHEQGPKPEAPRKPVPVANRGRKGRV